jgi:hypothetical protein
MGLAKNGCHRVIRDVRHRYTSGEFILTIDAENAHNSISRQSCWNSLQSRKQALPYTRAFFRLAYSSTSNVHYQHSGAEWLSIPTNVGVRQGCPSAGFAYNIATSDALNEVVRSFPQGMSIYGIHDDLTICCPDAAQLASVFPAVRHALASVGLRINIRKCEFLAPPRLHAFSSQVSPCALASDANIPFVDGALSSVRILGAHVGADASTRAYIEQKWEATKLLIHEVAALGKLQPRAAVALLKFCCQPKLLYRFCVHEPALCAHVARMYDDHVMGALRSFIADDIMRELVTSSFGLGFADYPMALPILYDKFLNNSADLNEGPQADPLAEMRATHDATVLARFPHLKARLVSQAAAVAGSTSWISPFIPHHFAAHHADVISFLRFVLLADPRGCPCPCGVVDRSDGTYLQHVLTCNRPKGSTRTHRHDLILVALDFQIKRFGIFTVTEPRFYEYDDGSRKRPDQTCFVQPPICTDLVISVDPDAAIEEKKMKHEAAVAQRGHIFMPIAMSIFGEFHPSVDGYLRKVFHELPAPTRRLAILQTKRSMSEAWLAGSCEIFNGVRHYAASKFDDATLDLASSA